MAVGADTSIGIGHGSAFDFGGPDCFGNIFKINLMADASAWRYGGKIIKAALSPFQKLVTFRITGHFQIDIFLQGRCGPRHIHHHRMVNDQINGAERIYFLGVAAHILHGVAHGGKVNNGGHAGEILHQYPGWAILDFPAFLAQIFLPVHDGLYVAGGNGDTILITQQIFQQYFKGIGQTGNIAQFFRRRL